MFLIYKKKFLFFPAWRFLFPILLLPGLLVWLTLANEMCIDFPGRTFKNVWYSALFHERKNLPYRNFSLGQISDRHVLQCGRGRRVNICDWKSQLYYFLNVCVYSRLHYCLKISSTFPCMEITLLCSGVRLDHGTHNDMWAEVMCILSSEPRYDFHDSFSCPRHCEHSIERPFSLFRSWIKDDLE